MGKNCFALLVVATVIATILVAGCSSPTQTSPQVASSSSNTSSTTSSTTTTSSVTPSPSASVSASSSTPTAAPPASGKIATSIAATGLNSPPPSNCHEWGTYKLGDRSDFACHWDYRLWGQRYCFDKQQTSRTSDFGGSERLFQDSVLYA